MSSSLSKTIDTTYELISRLLTISRLALLPESSTLSLTTASPFCGLSRPLFTGVVCSSLPLDMSSYLRTPSLNPIKVPLSTLSANETTCVMAMGAELGISVKKGESDGTSRLNRKGFDSELGPLDKVMKNGAVSKTIEYLRARVGNARDVGGSDACQTKEWSGLEMVGPVEDCAEGMPSEPRFNEKERE